MASPLTASAVVCTASLSCASLARASRWAAEPAHRTKPAPWCSPVFHPPGLTVTPPVGAVSVEVVADERRPDTARLPRAHAFYELRVEAASEVRAARGVAKPAAVVAVARGRDQRRKVAALSTCANLLDEPAGLHAGFLSVEVAVADDHDDLRVADARGDGGGAAPPNSAA